ncbi:MULTISPECIES: PepSY domain-containing protein [Streptomyces]|uniref:PepSY domain-containing protein n=1 Tax=Streptomyces TaxID=1883 RepID=UPI0031F8EC93|nr:PepSY domain-containing protein [Streptomyces antimycoticus]
MKATGRGERRGPGRADLPRTWPYDRLDAGRRRRPDRRHGCRQRFRRRQRPRAEVLGPALPGRAAAGRHRAGPHRGQGRHGQLQRGHRRRAEGRARHRDLRRRDGSLIWEVDVFGKDHKNHDVTVDAASGKVLNQHVDHDDNDNQDDGDDD